MAQKSKGQSNPNKSQSEGTFAVRYPHTAGRILEGWIEIGGVDYSNALVRALDEGGLVCEGAFEGRT